MRASRRRALVAWQGEEAWLANASSEELEGVLSRVSSRTAARRVAEGVLMATAQGVPAFDAVRACVAADERLNDARADLGMFEQVLPEPDDGDWLEAQQQAAADLVEAADDVATWRSWHALRAEADERGLLSAAGAFRCGFTTKEVIASFEKALYGAICTEELAADATAESFSGAVLEQTIEQYRAADAAYRARLKEARWAERSAVLMHADVALEARGACFRYKREEEWVLRGLDMRVARGSVHVVVGGNGSGKSTLLKLLADVLKPQRGSVCNQLASVQALMPQDPKALFVCDTVVEELAEWQSRCGYGEVEIRVALERFNLAEHAAQHPYDLSGGQRQKLAMAKLLLTDPQLLFLDEPTKGLDPASCADVVRLLRALADEGRTVVLVTHDLDFAFAVADDVSMVFDGELACTEPARAFFDNNLVYCPNAESRLFGELLR